MVDSVSPQFMLFLAVDASALMDEVIRNTARELIARGMASLSVWGSECSRVHDLFDLERKPDESQTCSVTTAWYEEDPLPEALWAFANVDYPAEDFEADCTDWVAISIDNSEWEQVMIRELVEMNAGFPP
jgi:hypothetical protein